jgi:hypothetical protein
MFSAPKLTDPTELVFLCMPTKFSRPNAYTRSTFRPYLYHSNQPTGHR